MPDGGGQDGRKPVPFAAEIEASRNAVWQEHLREVRAALRNNAATVTEKLMGAPKHRSGGRWRYSGAGQPKPERRTDAQGGPGTGGEKAKAPAAAKGRGALHVMVSGPRAGLWHDKSTDEGGDLLRLVQRRHGGGFGEAVAWAREQLGIPAPDFAKRLTAEDRRRMDARAAVLAAEGAAEQAAAEAAKLARQETVARRSAIAWAGSKPAAADHPYLRRKGVGAEGLRLDRRGRLRVPMRDMDGKLWALQTIDAHGTKLFPRGGRMAGTFFMAGEPDPARPVAFAEGVATAKDVRAISGLPVAATLSVGNKERVVAEWRARHPDQALIDAADDDRREPLAATPPRNAGRDMAERLERDHGAVPALPPWKGHEAGSDWNDYARTHGRAAAAEAFRLQIAGRAGAAEGRTAMPDGTQAGPAAPAPANPPPPPAAPAQPPAAAAPPDPRRLLTEAMALESAAKLGMAPERAVAMARQSVASMSDEQVRDTLDSLPQRGWAMRPDGTLAPPGPPTDPMAALLGRMKEEAGPLAATHPSIVATVTALAERIEHLRHDRLRTRVAWAAEDLEKATGRPLEMPPQLRAEVTDRARTAPGLANDGMAALLAETRALRDPGLVSAIREEASKLARKPEAEQRGPEAAERVDRLAERVRLLRSPVAPPPAPAPEAAPVVSEPAFKAASPGPGPQVPAPTAPPPSPPQGGAGAAEAIARGQAVRAAGKGPPWDAAPAGPGLGERIAGIEARIGQVRAGRLVDAAAKEGDAALRALRRLDVSQDKPAALREAAIGAVQRYGDARVRAGDAAAASKLDGARLGPLTKLDEQVAREAGRLPGREDGKSVLEEVTGRAAEALREAAQRVAAAVAGAVAALKPKPAASPTPSPSSAP